MKKVLSIICVLTILLPICSCNSKIFNNSSSAPNSGALDESLSSEAELNQTPMVNYSFYSPPEEFTTAIESMDDVTLDQQALHKDLLQVGDCLIYFEKDTRQAREICFYLLDRTKCGTLFSTPEDLREICLWDETSLVLKFKLEDGLNAFFRLDLLSGELSYLPARNMQTIHMYNNKMYGVKSTDNSLAPNENDVYVISSTGKQDLLIEGITSYCFVKQTLYYVQSPSDAIDGNHLFAMDLENQSIHQLYDLEDHIRFISIWGSYLTYITQDYKALKIANLANGVILHTIPLSGFYFEYPHNSLTCYPAGVIVFDDMSDLSFPGSLLGFIDYSTGGFHRIGDITVTNYQIVNQTVYYLKYAPDDADRHVHLYEESLSNLSN